MKYPRLLVLGYDEASMLMRNGGGQAVRALLAIHGQREFAVDAPSVPHRLTLQFDDIDAPDQTDLLAQARFRAHQREAAELGLTMTPPTIDHAREIIAFAREIRDLDGVLLCHCRAGISRSAAAALLCLATWTNPGDEHDCYEYLLRVRPSALPHRDLVAFGDRLLGRGGSLLRTIS